MTLCQHVNNGFCTLCNIFWFCHLWLIFMTLLFRKLVNKTDIFLVVFLFLEPSTPCKKQKKMHILQLGSELYTSSLWVLWLSPMNVNCVVISHLSLWCKAEDRWNFHAEVLVLYSDWRKWGILSIFCVAVKLGGCQIPLQPTPLLPSRLGNTKVIRAELGALFSPDSVVGYLFFNRKAGVVLSVVVREPGTCKLQNCGVSAQKTKTKQCTMQVNCLRSKGKTRVVYSATWIYCILRYTWMMCSTGSTEVFWTDPKYMSNSTYSEVWKHFCHGSTLDPCITKHAVRVYW